MNAKTDIKTIETGWLLERMDEDGSATAEYFLSLNVLTRKLVFTKSSETGIRFARQTDALAMLRILGAAGFFEDCVVKPTEHQWS